MWKFPLFIAAVIVWPGSAQGENVALGKPAFQTSTELNLGDASHAVDGNIDTDYFAGSCSSTLEEDDPSWWVDLGQTYIIDRVDIVNRQDCCGGNLDPFDIHIGDSPRITENFKCRGPHHIAANQPSTAVDCPHMKGRYVGIRLPGPFRTLTLCEVRVAGEIDECATDPCVHGDCYDVIEGYFCFCHLGWGGTNCDTNIDECSSSPCVHGTCTDLVATYTCSCENGWTGQDCGQDIDECASSPCTHGTCSDDVGSYTCSCELGWTGQNCDQDINECLSSPCVHGTCRNDLGGYTCSCEIGWEGTNCDQDKDWCSDTDACQPGFTCQDSGMYYLCFPPHGAGRLPYRCSSDSCLDGMYCTFDGVECYSCKPE